MTTPSLSVACWRFVAAPLGLLVLGACASSMDWREVDVGSVPFEDAWEAFAEIALVDGFPGDPAGSDRGMKMFESRWRAREMPFRRGDRRRVHAEFNRVDENRGWQIRYHVERQIVGDIAKAFSPQEEDWAPAGQDHETEDRFAAKLRARFPAAR